jgi:ActR/RegA family two-component response regulator
MGQAIGRALVVEDDPSWRQILTEVLSDMGLVVDASENAVEAVDTLCITPHRLAVVDLALKAGDHHNQDGLMVLEAIRSQDPDCVAILLTGFATAELSNSVLGQQTAYACLHKEAFRRAEFRKIISAALSLPQP